MVTFWPDHVPFWKVLVPEDKLFCLGPPPIDQSRYSPEGEVHVIDPSQRGGFNILIADAWREDIDTYEIVHAPMEAAQDIPGMRVHVYAVEMPLPYCWELIMHRLRSLGILGEVWARAPHMDRVYRSMDCVLSPHRIVTRIIGEALSCGIPVVAAEGCEYTPYTANPADAVDMGETLVTAYRDWRGDPQWVKNQALTCSRAFDPLAFGERMKALYQRVLSGVTVP
jgi:glycosyltransferase involved in cell wall biosynthesis